MTPNSHRAQARDRERGFTMLEVLISIVVIAFGMLGVAGLQAFALKNSQGASYRSVATVLANDLVDRVRANPVGATNSFYVTAAGVEGAQAQAANCLTQAGCASPQELAGHDLFEWHALLASTLPSGVGTVCRDDSPDDGTSPTDPQCSGAGALVIKIWWIDDRNRSNTNAGDATLRKLRFATEFQI